MPDLELSEAEGLLISARGDGRTYWVDLRRQQQDSGTSFRADMPTTSGEIVEVFIPFSAFQFTSFGRPLRGPVLNPGEIKSIGFTLADKNAGPFVLEIDSIQAAMADAPPSPQPKSPQSLILLALERGVPLFNSGLPEACRAIYEITAEALIIHPQTPQRAREELTLALQRMRLSSSESDKAWILREALDRTFPKL